MKRRKVIGLIAFFLVFGLLISGLNFSTIQADMSSCLTDHCVFLPIISKPPGVYQGGLIIDHNNIDIDQIPDTWLAKAKELTFHYAHTSHGSQIVDGLGYLETEINAKYAFDVVYGSSPPTLPSGSNILKIYDGNNYNGDDYIVPEMYWDGTDGINHTLSTAGTGLFDYSMWSWCGQAETSDTTYIDNYLMQMRIFDTSFPNMRFILMTGHNVTNPGTDLLARNQQIRNYAIANQMILFDFADIETYDPDGVFYDPVVYDYSGGDCPWCSSWCASQPSYCTNLPSYCAHTHGLFCKMKAQAFWWMMARLAGWSGNP